MVNISATPQGYGSGIQTLVSRILTVAHMGRESRNRVHSPLSLSLVSFWDVGSTPCLKIPM